MVGPVHHISRRDHINGINISIGIVHGTIVLRFIFLRVICHIDINSSIIFHRIWIRAKLMVYQRIGIARLLCQRSHIYVFQCYDRFRTADILGHLVSLYLIHISILLSPDSKLLRKLPSFLPYTYLSRYPALLP